MNYKLNGGEYMSSTTLEVLSTLQVTPSYYLPPLPIF
jgi:hypothetical protein